MLIEITGVSLENGIVRIYGTDCSEENLQRIERIRDDGFEEEITFLIDTTQAKEQLQLYRWLKHQKATRKAKTYGEALQATIGTITTISGKYRDWG